MKPFQFAKKCRKHAISKLIFWKIFWVIAHRPPNGEGLYGLLSQTCPPRRKPRRFAPPANRSQPWVLPSALPGNKADLWMHCPILWSGAATVFQSCIFHRLFWLWSEITFYQFYSVYFLTALTGRASGLLQEFGFGELDLTWSKSGINSRLNKSRNIEEVIFLPVFLWSPFFKKTFCQRTYTEFRGLCPS